MKQAQNTMVNSQNGNKNDEYCNNRAEIGKNEDAT